MKLHELGDLIRPSAALVPVPMAYITNQFIKELGR